MSLETSFGPFASVFEVGDLDVPGHLVLLGLHGPAVQAVIDRVDRALQHDDATRWVAPLLRDVNWRPHLVGSIAFLLQPALDQTLLWHAIDGGSWVTPQLVVTAMFVAPTFQEQAQRRVAALCPVTVPAGLTPAERHSATGPAGRHERSAKMLASLLTATAEFPDLVQWQREVLQDDRIQSLLAVDAASDRSDRIVKSWSASARDAFLARGRRLIIPAR